MINPLKAWKEHRARIRKAQNDDRFRDGYGWAMTALLHDRMSLEEAAAYCGCFSAFARSTTEPDYFDLGAQKALADVEAWDSMCHHYGQPSIVVRAD